MEKYSAFAETCIGASHLRRSIVCQDASIAVNKDNYSFAAVADGHGSPQYLRTDRGAQLCVKSAAECVEEFLRSLENAAEKLSSEKERRLIFSQLWRSIVSRWHEYAEADFRDNPFTGEELDRIPQDKCFYREKYIGGDYLRAYGTTLIMAVVTDEFAFGIQIGDGKCVAVGADAEVWEPIPADSRCYDCITTSMSQDDAVLSGRFCWFEKEKIPPAIFLGSDGIDDSYGDDELLYAFYRGLALTFAQSGLEEGVRQLSEFLPGMTKKGSGDDVSCAGIICLERLEKLEKALLDEVDKTKNDSSATEETQ